MARKILTLFIFAGVLMVSAMTAFAGSPQDKGIAGAVYTMTNADDNNQVVVFDRYKNGRLTLAGMVSTGGLGSGGALDPLGSQGALSLAKSKWLLAVNAGSNDVSLFRVKPDGLELMDIVDSGGEFPVSLTVIDNLVYVLNAGGEANIAGFFLSPRGRLIPRDDSIRSLGAGGFAQVGFEPRGKNLVVTDRDENEILVFPLDWHDLPATVPVTTPSNGLAPFGFIFAKGTLLVSEAGSGAVSSYEIMFDSSLRLVSPSVANEQTATCWITGNKQDYIFTANTGSQTLSAYTLGRGKEYNNKYGSSGLVLLDKTAGFGDRPIDMDISVDGRFLYALDPSAGTIDMFEIRPDGSLIDLGMAAAGISIFAQGLAAY